MKKFCFLGLICILVISLFVSCAPADGEEQVIPYEKDYPAALYKVEVDETGNGGGPTIPNPSATIWSLEYFKNEAAPAEQTVVFDGTEYVGAYENSTIQAKTSYVTDFYTVGGVRFGIRSDTGELVSLNCATARFFLDQALAKDVENPEQYAISYAKDMAATFVNVDDYTMSVTSEPMSKLVDGTEYTYTCYTVNFDKMYGDVKTADGFTFRITSRGALASYAGTERGTFDAFENENCTAEAIEASIYAMIKEEAEKNEEWYIWTDYQAKEHTIVKLPDGRFAVYSSVSVSWYNIQSKDTYKNGYRLYMLLEA